MLHPAVPRRLLLLLAFFVVGFLGPVSPAARGAEDPKVEKAATKQRERIADLWLDLAQALARKGHPAEARHALEEARGAGATTARMEKVAAQVEALEGEGAEPDAATLRLIEKAKKDVAKAWEKLADIHGEEDPRFAASLFRALDLDPSKGRVGKLAEVGKKGFLLVRAPEHPFVAFLSLPRGWQPGREYPVLVSVEGAGCNFQGNATSFRSARGSRAWITISPFALSCTNALEADKYPHYERSVLTEWDARRVEFDLTGLLAVLDYARRHFGASERVAVTGFSGGGNLAYGLTLRHPARVMAAAPACANFHPGLVQGAPKVEDGGPPVHVLTGENDPHRHLTHGKSPPGIEEQTDWAVKALEDQGFSRVRRTMLPNVGHSALPQQVWDFLDEVAGRR